MNLNLSAVVGGGRWIVYGTDDGVYLSDLREQRQEPVKVLALLDVVQVDILEDYQLLIVMSGKFFFFWALKYLLIFLFTNLRTTSYHLPSRCSGSARPNGGFETSETNIITYVVFQSWILLGQSSCLHRQVKSAFKYVQDSRAN